MKSSKEVFAIEDLMRTIRDISVSHHAKFKDKYCKTEFIVGHGTFQDCIATLSERKQKFKLISSPLVKDFISPFRKLESSHDTEFIISVGAAREHIQSKLWISNEQSKSLIPHLITCPVPLTNDAFCTNRMKGKEDGLFTPSKPSVFSNVIIIDLKLLQDVGAHLSIPGIGEVVGLYTSVIDYYHSRGKSIPKSLLDIIVESVKRLKETDLEDEILMLSNLYKGLLIKCLVMRISSSHAIGASGDHLIAYALESELQKNSTKSNHGELVYLGTIAILLLFPEWRNEIYQPHSLLKHGMRMGLVKKNTLRLLMNNFRSIVEKAPYTRSTRPTTLREINYKRIDNALVELKFIGGQYLEYE